MSGWVSKWATVCERQCVWLCVLAIVMVNTWIAKHEWAAMPIQNCWGDVLIEIYTYIQNGLCHHISIKLLVQLDVAIISFNVYGFISSMRSHRWQNQCVIWYSDRHTMFYATTFCSAAAVTQAPVGNVYDVNKSWCHVYVIWHYEIMNARFWFYQKSFIFWIMFIFVGCHHSLTMATPVI